MDALGRWSLTALAAITTLGWSIAGCTLARATYICPEQADAYELALADTQGRFQEVSEAKIASGACGDLPNATYIRTLYVYKDDKGVESRVIELCAWGTTVYSIITKLPRGVWEVTWREEYSKLPVEVLQWYKHAELTPEAQKRFGWKNCCDHAYLVENAGIDPAILAAALNRTEQFVRMRQRKLGLRKCVSRVNKGARHEVHRGNAF